MDLISNSPLSFLIISFVFFALFSAFFSGVEAAYLSLNRIIANRLERKGFIFAFLVGQYFKNIDFFIISVLFFNLFNNILAALFAKIIFERTAPHLFENIYLNQTFLWVLFIIVFTFFFIVFCEVIPKRISIYYAEKVVILGALPMFPIYILTYPLAYLLSRFAQKFIHTLMGSKDEEEQKFFARDQFLGYIKLGSDTGFLKKLETNMLESLVMNKNISVKSLLIPRQEMKAFNLKELSENLLKQIKSFEYNTIPVYEGVKDNIIGILSKRKLALKNDLENISHKTFKKYLEIPKLVPESTMIIDVLSRMNEDNSELAIITDEHGGVEGIVTYVDIINKLFGKNKNGDEELSIRKLGLSHYLINPQVSLNTINEYFKVRVKCDRAETIGGYVLELVGEIPKVGTVVKDKRFEIIVREASKKRIKKLLLRKIY